MKNQKNLKGIIIISIILLGLSFTDIIYNQEQEEDLIIGLWKSERDIKWTIEFKEDGKCHWNYTGEPEEIYNYSISLVSPQCGKNVPTGNRFSYLHLKEVLNSNNELCYEINTLNEQSLALIYLGGMSSEPMVFKKIRSTPFENPHEQLPDDLLKDKY